MSVFAKGSYYNVILLNIKAKIRLWKGFPYFKGGYINIRNVFEFLLLHKHSADDDEEDLDSVELVDDEQLGLLIEELPLFVVLFYQVWQCKLFKYLLLT